MPFYAQNQAVNPDPAHKKTAYTGTRGTFLLTLSQTGCLTLSSPDVVAHGCDCPMTARAAIAT